MTTSDLEIVSEDYLADQLPEGWSYDCYIGNDMPWHFVIMPPGVPIAEAFRLAFSWLDMDGFAVYETEEGPSY